MAALVVSGILLAAAGLVLQLCDVRLLRTPPRAGGRHRTLRLFAAGVVCQIVGVILIVVGGVAG
jgi:hypothetical protein